MIVISAYDAGDHPLRETFSPSRAVHCRRQLVLTRCGSAAPSPGNKCVTNVRRNRHKLKDWEDTYILAGVGTVSDASEDDASRDSESAVAFKFNRLGLNRTGVAGADPAEASCCGGAAAGGTVAAGVGAGAGAGGRPSGTSPDEDDEVLVSKFLPRSPISLTRAFRFCVNFSGVGTASGWKALLSKTGRQNTHCKSQATDGLRGELTDTGSGRESGLANRWLCSVPASSGGCNHKQPLSKAGPELITKHRQNPIVRLLVCQYIHKALPGLHSVAQLEPTAALTSNLSALRKDQSMPDD